MLTIVHDELGERSEPVFERFCDDKLVESLLCLHGLHPIALEERVEEALESVLPYVKSHKGNMEVSRIEGDVVYLRLEGSCDGCPASAATLKLAVERAILDRVPEIREVRAEEMHASEAAYALGVSAANASGEDNVALLQRCFGSGRRPASAAISARRRLRPNTAT